MTGIVTCISFQALAGQDGSLFFVGASKSRITKFSGANVRVCNLTTVYFEVRRMWPDQRSVESAVGASRIVTTITPVP
jgi:hypothetical protein